jgi:hypothetical protein
VPGTGELVRQAALLDELSSRAIVASHATTKRIEEGA